MNEKITCPKCGAEQEDLDGLGFDYCPECGYCTHASISDGICEACGKDFRPKTEKGILMPTGYSFFHINEFVHHPDVGFEELQWAMIGMANHFEKTEKEPNKPELLELNSQ